jgi:hypothetical protein
LKKVGRVMLCLGGLSLTIISPFHILLLIITIFTFCHVWTLAIKNVVLDSLTFRVDKPMAKVVRLSRNLVHGFRGCYSISFEHKYPYQKSKDLVFTIIAQK